MSDQAGIKRGPTRCGVHVCTNCRYFMFDGAEKRGRCFEPSVVREEGDLRCTTSFPSFFHLTPGWCPYLMKTAEVGAEEWEP